MIDQLLKRSNVTDGDDSMDTMAQIKSGVEQFVRSQDPEMAVEIVNMLAGIMGVSAEVEPQQDIDLEADIEGGLDESMVPQIPM